MRSLLRIWPHCQRCVLTSLSHEEDGAVQDWMCCRDRTFVFMYLTMSSSSPFQTGSQSSPSVSPSGSVRATADTGRQLTTTPLYCSEPPERQQRPPAPGVLFRLQTARVTQSAPFIWLVVCRRRPSCLFMSELADQRRKSPPATSRRCCLRDGHRALGEAGQLTPGQAAVRAASETAAVCSSLQSERWEPGSGGSQARYGTTGGREYGGSCGDPGGRGHRRAAAPASMAAPLQRRP